MTFDDVYPTLPNRGWLAEEEARLLWDTARNCAGDILEIGTYCGRSAVLLASAIASTNPSVNRRLFCCDPFLVGFDGEKTPSQKEIVLGTLTALCRGRLAPYVTICWQSEATLADYWPGPLPLPNMVYVDGDHSYEGTLGALRRWASRPCVVAMHDYGQCAEFEGVRRAAGDFGLGSPSARAGSLAVFIRRPQ